MAAAHRMGNSRCDLVPRGAVGDVVVICCIAPHPSRSSAVAERGEAHEGFSGGLNGIHFAAGYRSTEPRDQDGGGGGIVIHLRPPAVIGAGSGDAPPMYRMPEDVRGGGVGARDAVRVQHDMQSGARSEAGARPSPP